MTKERPIIFSTESVRAILDGRKTQTRRAVKPQPSGLIFNLNNKGIFYEHTVNEWRNISSISKFTEYQLHGWNRRQHLLTSATQRLWEQGVRGLVSVEVEQNKKGYRCISLCHNNKKVTRFVHRLICEAFHGKSCSANLQVRHLDGNPENNLPGKSCLGHTSGELDGQKNTRTRHGRKTPYVQTDRQGTRCNPVGGSQRNMQPEACCEGAGNVVSVHHCNLPFSRGTKLWVREAFWCFGDSCIECWHRADVSDDEMWAFDGFKWDSPLFMPRKFSRLTLEITDVRCERLQDITENDAISEGMLLYERWQSDDYKNDVITAKASGTKPPLGFSPKKRFAHLWDSLNLKRGFGWDTNPWVWVIEFKRVEKEGRNE